MRVHVRRRLQGHVAVSLPADLRQQLRVQLVGSAALRRAAAGPQPQGEQLAAEASRRLVVSELYFTTWRASTTSRGSQFEQHALMSSFQHCRLNAEWVHWEESRWVLGSLSDFIGRPSREFPVYCWLLTNMRKAVLRLAALLVSSAGIGEMPVKAPHRLRE